MDMNMLELPRDKDTDTRPARLLRQMQGNGEEVTHEGGKCIEMRGELVQIRAGVPDPISDISLLSAKKLISCCIRLHLKSLIQNLK